MPHTSWAEHTDERMRNSTDCDKQSYLDSRGLCNKHIVSFQPGTDFRMIPINLQVASRLKAKTVTRITTSNCFAFDNMTHQREDYEQIDQIYPAL